MGDCFLVWQDKSLMIFDDTQLLGRSRLYRNKPHLNYCSWWQHLGDCPQVWQVKSLKIFDNTQLLGRSRLFAISQT